MAPQLSSQRAIELAIELAAIELAIEPLLTTVHLVAPGGSVGGLLRGRRGGRGGGGGVIGIGGDLSTPGGVSGGVDG